MLSTTRTCSLQPLLRGDGHNELMFTPSSDLFCSSRASKLLPGSDASGVVTLLLISRPYGVCVSSDQFWLHGWKKSCSEPADSAEQKPTNKIGRDPGALWLIVFLLTLVLHICAELTQSVNCAEVASRDRALHCC